jgi:5-(hydroxymethyl)furfural/furfural oxidase
MSDAWRSMERFDWVVVGAGSAGAVVAAWLSDDPQASVLLLEAGPDHASADTPPGIAGANFFSAVSTPGRTWPDLVAVRRPGQTPAPYVRGLGVGGSSAVNAMMAIRGIPEDYDRWAREFGCDGWAWSDLLPAFLAVEDDADYGGDGLHGRGGPIPLTRLAPSVRSPLDEALRLAAADLGYPSSDDYHAPGATGMSRIAITIRNGRRVSTNDAYLEPARGRPNLTVRGDTLVDRVALDGRRAVGVVTAAGDEIAAGDVFVCAGAIHSPAILLRSGIGPDIGLPVGANLIDHACPPGFELALRERARMNSTEPPMTDSALRFSSELADAGPNDLQITWFRGVGDTPESLATARLLGGVMRVYSRGAVRLASSDPNDDPIVEFNMLSDERDAVRARVLVEHMVELVRHPAVAALVTDVIALDRPVETLSTHGEIDAWLSACIDDYVHAAGTCRMGRPGDPAAVVDHECRVIGFEHLRVCDASIMPDLPRANTHLTTVAIAEHACRLMRRVSP